LVYAAGGVLHTAGAFRALQRFVLPDRVAIAMYHGVTARPLPVYDWCFTSALAFTRHMEYLARHFTVMHIEDALAPERPVADRPVACVTFDDGFEGVYELALPVLERLHLPATVYLVTDLVDSDRTVWFARLHQALTETSSAAVTHRGVRFPLSDAGARSSSSARLQELLKELPSEELDAALDHLLEELGFGRSRRARVAPPFRILSSEQIRRMSRDDLVRFGGHTATHQILARATPQRAALEIERSIQAIGALVRRPSASFAYPNGRPEDFDESAVETLRGAGIRYGMTTIEGPNERRADPYRIRRYGIGAEDPLPRFAGLMHHSRAAVHRLVSRSR
jgi:peptidoglycan/xylan/chitin deacetylase (PgdA/CDA1 family)